MRVPVGASHPTLPRCRSLADAQRCCATAEGRASVPGPRQTWLLQRTRRRQGRGLAPRMRETRRSMTALLLQRAPAAAAPPSPGPPRRSARCYLPAPHGAASTQCVPAAAPTAAAPTAAPAAAPAPAVEKLPPLLTCARTYERTAAALPAPPAAHAGHRLRQRATRPAQPAGPRGPRGAGRVLVGAVARSSGRSGAGQHLHRAPQPACPHVRAASPRAIRRCSRPGRAALSSFWPCGSKMLARPPRCALLQSSRALRAVADMPRAANAAGARHGRPSRRRAASRAAAAVAAGAAAAAGGRGGRGAGARCHCRLCGTSVRVRTALPHPSPPPCSRQRVGADNVHVVLRVLWLAHQLVERSAAASPISRFSYQAVRIPAVCTVADAASLTLLLPPQRVIPGSGTALGAATASLARAYDRVMEQMQATGVRVPARVSKHSWLRLTPCHASDWLPGADAGAARRAARRGARNHRVPHVLRLGRAQAASAA